MTTVITLVAATLVGLFLFTFALPRSCRWIAARVQSNEQMDFFQKIKLLNALENFGLGSTTRANSRGTMMLSVVFFVLVGVQHYFLFIGNGTIPRIIVTAMFALLIVYFLKD